MSCYYKIQLPGGGFVKIPSPITLLEVDASLQKKIDAYFSHPNIAEFQQAAIELYKKRVTDKFADLEEKFQALYAEEYKLYDAILDEFNSYKNAALPTETIAKYLRISTADNFVNNLQEKIMSGVTSDALESAVRRWAYYDLKQTKTTPEGRVYPKSLNHFLELTSKEITPGYFSELPFLDIVGKSTLSDEVTNLNQTISKLENDYQLRAIIQKNVKGFLNVLKKDETKDVPFLYGITRTGTENDTLVIPKSDTSSGFVYFNKGNELSLFLGLFKLTAANINWSPEEISKLKILINDWNSTAETKINLQNFSPKKFFAGQFTENRFAEGGFHRFLGGLSTKFINQLVELVGDNLPAEQQGKFKEYSRNLFKWIDPKKYGTAIFSSDRIASSEYDVQTLKNIGFKVQLIANKFGIYNTKERDKYFDQAEIKSVTGENAIQEVYLYLQDKVELGKDIIKIPGKTKEYDRYVTVTKLSAQKDGISVKGITFENNLPEERDYFIKATKDKEDKTPSLTVNFRKFESKEEPYIAAAPGKLTDAKLIKSKHSLPLPKKLVKKYIQVGSMVSYIDSTGRTITDTVKGVLPGVLSLSKSRFPIKLDRIIEFNSNKLSEDDLKDWRETDFADNPNLNVRGIEARILPTAGDIIEYNDKGIKRINKVLASDKDGVYILIKTQDNAYIERIDRTVLTGALINIDQTTMSELQTAAGNIHNIFTDNSIRKNTYSFSQNIEEAREGDIFVKLGATPEEHIYNKLIDKDSLKVIQRVGLTSTDYRAKILNPNSVDGFLTTRDISGQFGLDINRVNNVKLFTSLEGDTKKSNVVYIIPSDLDLNYATLFDSYHFNIGSVVARSHFENPKNALDYEGMKDVTDQAVKLIARKLNTPIKQVNIKIDEKNVYTKFVDELLRINHFDKFSEEDKIAGIQVGAYVKLTDGKLGKKLFRVSEDMGNNVMLEYSILDNQGDFKTIRTLMTKVELANRIAAFYLIKGNSKITSLLKKAETLGKQDKRTKEDIREAFAFTIQTALKTAGANIKVDIVPALGNFDSTTDRVEKAKIQEGRILINKDTGTSEDVVHEFLHVFLIGLKYSSPENSQRYKALMLDFWENELDGDTTMDSFDKMEEAFVKKLSEVLVGKADLDFSSLESIELGLLAGIEGLGLDATNLVSYDLHTVLNTSIKKLIKAKGTNKNFTDLLIFEANFRDWIAENIESKNLLIECK